MFAALQFGNPRAPIKSDKNPATMRSLDSVQNGFVRAPQLHLGFRVRQAGPQGQFQIVRL
jgi:hypothetical protein